MRVRTAGSVRGALVALALAACNPPGAQPDCVPGASTACICAGGAAGFHVCGSDGVYGACVCGDAGGGPASDVGDVGAIADADADASDATFDALGVDGAPPADGNAVDAPDDVVSETGPPSRCRFCPDGDSEVSIDFQCATVGETAPVRCTGMGTMTYVETVNSRISWIGDPSFGLIELDDLKPLPDQGVPLIDTFSLAIGGYSPYSGFLDNQLHANCKVRDDGLPYVDVSASTFDANSIHFPLTCVDSTGMHQEVVSVQGPMQSWLCSECHGDDVNTNDAGHRGRANLTGGFSGEFTAAHREMTEVRCTFAGSFVLYQVLLDGDYCSNP